MVHGARQVSAAKWEWRSTRDPERRGMAGGIAWSLDSFRSLPLLIWGTHL